MPIILSDRFPTADGPDHWLDMPADRRERWLRLLSVEGEVAILWAEASEGLGPNDDVFIAELEYDELDTD